MDVERTIEFILQTQAKTETQIAGITKLVQQGMRMFVRNETTVERLETTVERLETTVETLAVTVEGLAVTVEGLAEAQKRTDRSLAELSKEMKDLAKAQKTTERMFQAFIKGQRNGRNGR